jgi:hypothetical protein
MIKINGDENSLGGQSFNAFEVVTTRYDIELHLLV